MWWAHNAYAFFICIYTKTHQKMRKLTRGGKICIFRILLQGSFTYTYHTGWCVYTRVHADSQEHHTHTRSNRQGSARERPTAISSWWAPPFALSSTVHSMFFTLLPKQSPEVVKCLDKCAQLSSTFLSVGTKLCAGEEGRGGNLVIASQTMLYQQHQNCVSRVLPLKLNE